jgi:hypothetical protein
MNPENPLRSKCHVVIIDIVNHKTDDVNNDDDDTTACII